MSTNPAPPRPEADTNADALADCALMQRVVAGDRLAFEQLAIRYLPRLKQAALRVLCDQTAAEDVGQEAMLRAWTHGGRYDPARGSLAIWLHRIAVNLAVDQVRRRRPVVSFPDQTENELPDGAEAADAGVIRRQRHAALRAGLAQLPPRQRAAIALVYGQDRTGAEAAASLQVSLRALEGLLRRGRLILRDYLLARDA